MVDWTSYYAVKLSVLDDFEGAAEENQGYIKTTDNESAYRENLAYVAMFICYVL